MNIIKRSLLIFSCAVAAYSAMAQDNDPVLLTIDGNEVRRSEFEYNYNKNNSGSVYEKMSVEDYLPLFINFKLKVVEAEAQKLDTLQSFKDEYATNRELLAEEYLVDFDYIEREAYNVYRTDSMKIGADGLVSIDYFAFPLSQDASKAEIENIVLKGDTLYNLLQQGASINDIRGRYSKNVVYVPREVVTRGQLVTELENAIFNLEDSVWSKPVLAPFGVIVARRLSTQKFGEYSEYHDAIIGMLESQNIKGRAKYMRGVQLAKEIGGDITPEEALVLEDSRLEEKYPDFGHLMREYREGLLFFEVCSREVWNKEDISDKELRKYFKKNRKNYVFDAPRYRGGVIYAKSQEDLDRAQQLFEGQPREKYKDIIAEHFYVDSTYTLRMEVGVFKKGDNGWVDKYVFNEGDGGSMKRGFQVAGVTGVLISEPEDFRDVQGLVQSDYQKVLEEKWVKKLRKRYKVKVNEEVLKTVNNHK